MAGTVKYKANKNIYIIQLHDKMNKAHPTISCERGTSLKQSRKRRENDKKNEHFKERFNAYSKDFKCAFSASEASEY